LVKDLGKRIPLLLKRSFAGFRVIDGMELVCGGVGGYNLEKLRRLQPGEAAAATTWRSWRRLQPREAAAAAAT
jgi:hypothetical protein